MPSLGHIMSHIIILYCVFDYPDSPDLTDTCTKSCYANDHPGKPLGKICNLSFLLAARDIIRRLIDIYLNKKVMNAKLCVHIVEAPESRTWSVTTYVEVIRPAATNKPWPKQTRTTTQTLSTTIAAAPTLARNLTLKPEIARPWITALKYQPTQTRQPWYEHKARNRLCYNCRYLNYVEADCLDKHSVQQTQAFIWIQQTLNLGSDIPTKLLRPMEPGEQVKDWLHR